jgi:hypothetical protein
LWWLEGLSTSERESTDTAQYVVPVKRIRT